MLLRKRLASSAECSVYGGWRNFPPTAERCEMQRMRAKEKEGAGECRSAVKPDDDGVHTRIYPTLAQETMPFRTLTQMVVYHRQLHVTANHIFKDISLAVIYSSQSENLRLMLQCDDGRVWCVSREKCHGC